MASFNKVILAGNLTRDPVVRTVGASGTKVADLGLAVSERYRDRQTGEVKESTCFVDVAVWGASAETAEKYLRKGRNVLIEGRLQMDEWTNDKGEKRSRLRVRADRFLMLGSAEGSTTQAATPSAQTSAPHAPSTPAPAVQEDEEDLPF